MQHFGLIYIASASFLNDQVALEEYKQKTIIKKKKAVLNYLWDFYAIIFHDILTHSAAMKCTIELKNE